MADQLPRFIRRPQFQQMLANAKTAGISGRDLVNGLHERGHTLEGLDPSPVQELVMHGADMLPGAGTMAGMGLGAAAGAPEGGIGAIPGAAVGGGAGGFVGTLGRRMIYNAMGREPLDTTGASLVGLMPGSQYLTPEARAGVAGAIEGGAGQATTDVGAHMAGEGINVLNGLRPTLRNSPGMTAIQEAGNMLKASGPVKYIMQHGALGIRNIQALRGQLGAKLGQIINGDPDVIDPQQLVQKVQDRMLPSIAASTHPEEAQNYIDEFSQKFLNEPMNGAQRSWQNGEQMVSTPVPFSRAQQIAVDANDQARSIYQGSNFGTLPLEPARRAAWWKEFNVNLHQVTRDAINERYPQTVPINAQLSNLQNLQDELSRRASGTGVFRVAGNVMPFAGSAAGAFAGYRAGGQDQGARVRDALLGAAGGAGLSSPEVMATLLQGLRLAPAGADMAATTFQGSR